MSDPVISPDGEWMWTGTEWIPAPLSSTPTSNIVMQDSVIAGDVNISSNNVEDIKRAMMDVLSELNFTERPTNYELTAQDIEQMDIALELSSQLIENDIQLEPEHELILAEIISEKAKSEDGIDEFWALIHLETSHYRRAYEQYEKAIDLKNAAKVMKKWLRNTASDGSSEIHQHNRIEVFNLATKALDLARRAPYRELESEALKALAWSDVSQNQSNHEKLKREIDENLKRFQKLKLSKLERFREMDLFEGEAYIKQINKYTLWYDGSKEYLFDGLESQYIGNFYLRHNQLEKAEEWFLRSLDYEGDGNKVDLYLLYIWFGDLEIKKGDFKKAIHYYTLALEQPMNKLGRVQMLFIMGKAAYDGGDFQTSEQYYKSACLKLKSGNFWGLPQNLSRRKAIKIVNKWNIINAKDIIKKYW